MAFIVVLLISLALRFLHMGESIDGPHSWRQCDTASYIQNFYQDGVDFFHPAVCWMGGYKTLILEFALPEAIVAWSFDFLGASNFTSRLVFILFFCVGVFYFYKICRLMVNERTSQLATIIYTFLPLSYYYSRAIHIDFFALSASFAMYYHYSKGIANQSPKALAIGSFFAILAFLVKAPYAMPFVLPLLYQIYKEKKWSFCLKNSWIFLVPVIVFVWWVRQAAFINSQAPDWSFIPGYRKFDNNAKWYFGSFEHRFILRSWMTLGGRFIDELGVGIVGIMLLLAGMMHSWRKKQAPLLWFWLGGLVIYFFTFFNLNVIHNYYQIPFVPVFALFMALGINRLSDHQGSFLKRRLTFIGLVVALLLSCIYYSETLFFTRDTEYETIAAHIEKRSQPGDLVLVSHDDHSVHCPWILQRAHRNGWSVSPDILTDEIIHQLIAENCKHLAIIDDKIPLGLKSIITDGYAMETIDLKDEKGKRLYWINLIK